MNDDKQAIQAAYMDALKALFATFLMNRVAAGTPGGAAVDPEAIFQSGLKLARETRDIALKMVG